MADFQIVDVPQSKNNLSSSAAVINAMVANVGKAISLPLEGRDANNLRKTLRAAVVNRGMSHQYVFKTQITEDKLALLAWLEKKEAPAADLGAVQA